MNQKSFYQELGLFLEGLGSSFERLPEGWLFAQERLLVHPVGLDERLGVEDLLDISCRQQAIGVQTIHLWEDFWWRSGDLIRKRLTGRLLGLQRIHGRACKIRPVEKAEADRFLRACHLLGPAKAKYVYGLFYQEALVALASFSAMRPITREGKVFASSEWVRYASLPELRVMGGMGKLLAHFLAEQHPDDVMSYASNDWSEGAVYPKLGFKLVGETPPQRYWLDSSTLQRYPLKRYPQPQAGWIQVYGLGSWKYVLIKNNLLNY